MNAKRNMTMAACILALAAGLSLPGAATAGERDHGDRHESRRSYQKDFRGDQHRDFRGGHGHEFRGWGHERRDHWQHWQHREHWRNEHHRHRLHAYAAPRVVYRPVFVAPPAHHRHHERDVTVIWRGGF